VASTKQHQAAEMPAKIDIKFEWCTVNRKLLMVSTKQHQAAELHAKIDIRFEWCTVNRKARKWFQECTVDFNNQRVNNLVYSSKKRHNGHARNDMKRGSNRS